jgi:hypothetical protein
VKLIRSALSRMCPYCNRPLIVRVSREQVAALLTRNKAPTLRQVDQPSLRHIKLGPMNPIVKNFLSPTGEKLIALLGGYS